MLSKQIRNDEEVGEIAQCAEQVQEKWVNPLSGGREETNGLIYGLVQSGKTGVLTVTGAIGADDGYKTLLVLTSDNDPLYEQTLGRVKEAFPGMDILGKADFRDADSFLQRVKRGTTAIVATKNGSVLRSLVQNFKQGNVKGLSCLIIDDEADQASLNTRASKADGSRSAINDRIAELRQFFEKNTYLQVTATPQALFLQTPGHDFRPKFTVLSYPGASYVGGDDFFVDGSTLVHEFDINDLAMLSPGAQPTPSHTIPRSLLRALDTFMIGATYKRVADPEQNCAFLCHVSTRTNDHRHIVDLLHTYRADLSDAVRKKSSAVLARLRAAYDDLATTHAGIADTAFEDLIEAIAFFSPGISVKLVNGETDEDVAVRSPYNLFVGGNKLGRGVTIKNLLVSYYGRNPRSPQADTVLQHARMYGYRRGDIGLLRLFLPGQLHTVFKAINKMERSLRDLIAANPSEEFRGIYLEGGVKPTRKNVLAPGSLGVYTGGGNYNPAQVLRDGSVNGSTEKIDRHVEAIPSKGFAELPIRDIKQLVLGTMPDQSASERVWDTTAIAESIEQYAKLAGHETGYVYVDRERGLLQARRETQGILEGGEAGTVPGDKLTLFLLRTKADKDRHATWWPQIRLPQGRYAFAFSV